MQQQAAQAYQQVAKQTADPIEIEAGLLSKAASDMSRIKDNWEEGKSDLARVLIHNRRLWTVFLETVTKDENPLPREIRQNIANLGIFVLSHTLEVQAEPAPDMLEVLININREIAAGLRVRPDAG